jgi:hypothetical protein
VAKKKKSKQSMIDGVFASRALGVMLAEMQKMTTPERMAKVDATWDRHHARLMTLEQKLNKIDQKLDEVLAELRKAE